MATIKLELDDGLVSLMHSENEPIEQTALELIVLELYRRRTITSGKAAEVLGVRREDFIVHSGRLGIPFFDMTREELEEDLRTLRSLR